MKKILTLVVGLLFYTSIVFAGPPLPFPFSPPPSRLLPTGCTNGYMATYSTSTGLWGCTAMSGAGDLKADGTVPLTAHWNVGAYNITASNFIGALTGNASAGYIDFYEDSGDGSNYHRIIAAAMAGNVTTYLPNAAGATGGLWYFSAANQLANLAAGTAGYILKMGASVPEWSNTLSVSSISSGGIVLGDTTPDADGEIGYASNAYLWYANSEDWKITATTNLWTFDSNTSATFAFTPSVTFSAGAIIADSQKIVFDESAADPNDADIELSATDGVFKIAAANGANNEDLTIDLDQTANTAILNSGSGLTMITTGSIALTGAVRVSAKDSDYTIGTDNANEAYGGFFFNTGASTRTFTLPSAVAGMSVCIKNSQGVAQVLRLDAAAGDYIVMSTGARTSAAGEYYGCSSSAACMVCVVAYDATDWHVTAERGTWTEE